MSFKFQVYPKVISPKKISTSIACIVLCFTIFVGVSAQSNHDIVSQQHGWYMYFGNHKITDKYSLHTEYQWRRNDWITNWQQSLLRLGLDYQVNPNLIITAGYGWIQTFPYGKQPIAHDFNEHRIWQQLVLQQQSGRLYFHHRYRLEQRFLEHLTTNASGQAERDGYDYRNRARYRFMVTMPLNRKELSDNTLFVAVYDEVFLGFGGGIGKNILDQNRLYAALGWRFSKKFNIQIGYLNQYVVKTDGIRHERNHTLQTGITYNFDFRKKDPS